MKVEASPWARRLTWIILGLHGVLLACMLRDYFPNIDHAYHAALARQYAEHGAFWWDSINWGPGGRPNLQGPLLHYAIAAVGRLLGGSGDAYVLALAILACLQWAAAVWTAVYFARRIGFQPVPPQAKPPAPRGIGLQPVSGDLAALVAAAVLSGSVFAAGSFFVGVPSGWVFILTPWAIHFFLQGRTVLAVLFTTAAIYVHLGGITAAPFGVLVAALFMRQWRRLIITGACTVVLASPFIVHFLRHLDWYRGERGHLAFMIAPLVYLLAAPGLVWILRRPKEHVFLIAWVVAPAVWLYQDSIRFQLQSTIVASVLGGLFVAWAWERIPARTVRAALAGLLLAVATIYPLSIPSLALEAGWNLGLDFPRQLDWKQMRALAGIIERDKLNDRLVATYFYGLGNALAVYTPVRIYAGHWVEVQPRVYGAREMSAAQKAYVVPMPPDDAVLRDLASRGLVRIHGGTPRMSVVTLARQGALEETAALASQIISQEGAWLAEHAVNNVMPPPAVMFSRQGIAEWRDHLNEQRFRMGRIEIAVLIYAYALEKTSPEHARGARSAASGFGSIAAFLGDESNMDFMSEARHQRFRENIRRVAEQIRALPEHVYSTPELDRAVDALFAEYFWAA